MSCENSTQINNTKASEDLPCTVQCTTSRQGAEFYQLPCKVCGSRASGIHFGAITCGACKVFFRRALKSQKTFKCSEGGGCRIYSNGPGTMCQYCRLQKCKTLGMSRQSVQRGRYSLKKKRDCIIQVQTHSSIQTKSNDECEPEKEELISRVTQAFVKNDPIKHDMLAKIPEREKKFLETLEAEKVVFGETFKPIPKDEHMQLYKTTGLDIDNRLQDLNKCSLNQDNDMLKLIQFSKDIPEFKELPLGDQIILIKSNFFIWMLMYIHKTANIKEKVWHCTSCDNSYTFDMLFSYFGTDFASHLFEFTEKLLNIDASTEEKTLLILVAMLSSDDVVGQLQCKEVIERQQIKFMEALLYLIRKTRPKRHKTISQVMDFITNLRVYKIGWLHTAEEIVGSSEYFLSTPLLRALVEIEEDKK